MLRFSPSACQFVWLRLQLYGDPRVLSVQLRGGVRDAVELLHHTVYLTSTQFDTVRCFDAIIFSRSEFRATKNPPKRVLQKYTVRCIFTPYDTERIFHFSISFGADCFCCSVRHVGPAYQKHCVLRENMRRIPGDQHRARIESQGSLRRPPPRCGLAVFARNEEGGLQE